MIALLIKLLVTPLLIGGATLAGRRWGPTISGWLVGLPLMSGPISLFLAFEQGRFFAAHAAQGTLTGLISVSAYCITYSWLSLRMNWLFCWFGSWSIFFIATLLFEKFSLTLPVTFLCVILALLLASWLLPVRDEAIQKASIPRWDIPLRVAIATVFVISLTSLATLLGPRLSGLLSPLPLFSTIIAVFTQALYGASPARYVLRGVLTGSFAFALFFLIVAALLPLLSIPLTFLCALLGALCVQGFTLWLMRYRSVAT